MADHQTERIYTEPPHLVYNQKAFAQMLTRLRRCHLLAIDTESDSYFAYTPKVCLIQITICADPVAQDPTNVVDYLVDTLRLNDIAPLGAIFAQPHTEVVMHAADNDILLLRRDFGFHFQKIFDTQLAARILGWPGVGLAAILEERFGVISDKRMQRTNWANRPLTPQQIAYAQMDTHYLLSLRDLLIDELHVAGRLDEAQDAFSRLAQLDATEWSAPQRSFWQMKAGRSVERSNTGVLEALWELREKEAQRLNRPPFKVLSDDALVNLAAQQPTTMQELASTPGLSEAQRKRYGESILRAIRDGQARPLPPFPAPPVRPESLLDRGRLASYERLRRWRTETAQGRGVAPEIIFSNETLLEIVQRAPASEAELTVTPGVGPWKAKTYGASVLALLSAS
jgi:ribonuclease D